MLLLKAKTGKLLLMTNGEIYKMNYQELKRILEHKTEENKLQVLLKDLDAQRTDWERRSALFVPSKQRLEKGGKTLELGEDYEIIKDLRAVREKNKIRQSSLKDEITNIRTDLHNADEALNLIESEYRINLSEQSKLENTIQKVKILDEQIQDRQEAAIQVKREYEEANKQYKECSLMVEKEQTELEKIELSLRETRKFLQIHSTDEKLQSSLPGIKKCFEMYASAEAKKVGIKSSLSTSIQHRQESQNKLNDRAALFSDVTHRFSVMEKNFVRAKAFYESTLKGKSIAEWQAICDKNTQKLADLDDLYGKFQEMKSLEEKLKNYQDMKLKIQQEKRSLNILDVEQSGKIHELQTESEKLEKRITLLKRIQDLDAVRELLQENIPCPLCGSVNHPYTSGNIIPDPLEIQKQLDDTQKNLEKLQTELQLRQTRAGELNNKMANIGLDESELRKNIGLLNAETVSKISLLGLRFSEGISPFEELDRERQKTRDILQLARNNADTAEAAFRDMKIAGDELEKVRETRNEVTKYHQDALFEVQNAKSEEEQIKNEDKTQEEIVNSLKRELISQIMPYGYKALPDKNPVDVINNLEQRMNDWIQTSKSSIGLEHELSSSNTKMTKLKKERESLRLKREDLNSRLRAVEAERDSMQQQRIILFASKNPADENSRMNAKISELKSKLNERREAKNEYSRKLDVILTDLHSVETEMSKGREELQKHEIDFNKKLLALGFKNENDYAAACLTNDERRDLQNRLRELTQEDLDLKSERENLRAKILELQAEKINFSDDEIINAVKNLRNSLNPEETQVIKTLLLQCALPEVL